MPRASLAQNLAVLLLATILAGCASTPEVRKRMTYRTSARENFEKGLKAFQDEDYQEALEFFKFVKSKFPYSKYSAEADLYLAECKFKREQYLEAAEAYENFVKLHPRHPQVPYALFQAALCHYEKIPSDWFLIPPAYEMDQTRTRVAITKLRNFLKRYGQHEKAPEARRLLTACLRRMAQRAVYIMEFYRSREHYQAVVWRAEEILTSYPGVGFDELALWRKAQALVELERPQQARATLGQLLERFPKGKHSSEARALLASLPTREPAPRAKGEGK